jgi:signal transduction histidine kinase
MTTPRLPRLAGPPLGWQLIAMLVCTLVAAQLVTLALTVLLPPRPPRQWNIEDVAAALSGQHLSSRLEQARLAGPPDVAGAGWLISESAHAALARRLGRPGNEVVLAFYTQLPVGGVAVPARIRAPLAIAAPQPLSALIVPVASAQGIVNGPSGGFSGGFAGGSMPGTGFPGGMQPGGMPGSTMPGAGIPGRGGGQMPGHGAGPGGGQPGGGNHGHPGGEGHDGPGSGINNAMRAMPRALPDTAMPSGGPAMGSAILGQLRAPLSPHDTPAPLADLPAPVVTTSPVAGIAPPALARHEITPALLPPMAQAGAVAPRTLARPLADASLPLGQPQAIPFRSQPQGLLDRATPPFIEGDFIAAVRRPDGHWTAVAPRAEPFPNRWQKQVVAWFFLSLVIVSPLAWFFARRIVLPLEGFARAAEMLGRDPSATIIPLKGPAEIGRAAHAFNQMHNRLRAFVDDRTAMVGAISHDLRTPLTRLRFRLEDVPEDQRPALLREVAEMESMINEVIAFIRDASTPGARQRVDLATLVADSVADARLVGADVEIVGQVSTMVEADPVGIRRLLGNLLENAVKYGDRARVRVTLRDGEAMAEIMDEGPGILPEDMDRVFEPFYRSTEARKSGRPGSGLGLTVCRSIARAHGGDIRFRRGADGFAAVLTVPIMYDARPRLAA